MKKKITYKAQNHNWKRKQKYTRCRYAWYQDEQKFWSVDFRIKIEKFLGVRLWLIVEKAKTDSPIELDIFWY